MRVMCLAQEHNTMFPARPRTRTARSGVERTNHEVTAPPTHTRETPNKWLEETKSVENSLMFCHDHVNRANNPKGTGKRGHIAADSLLLMMFFWAAQTGKHLLRTQNVSEQNQKHVLCQTQNLCPQQMLRARANGKHLCRQQCVLVCQGLQVTARKFDLR